MKIFKKVRHVCLILKYYLFKDESAFLHLIKEEALDYLETCKKIGTINIEDVEDLIFHVDAYFEIPETVKSTMFTNLPKIKVVAKNNRLDLSYFSKNITKEQLDEFINYMLEVQRERAVERDFIYELLKKLPIGFTI